MSKNVDCSELVALIEQAGSLRKASKAIEKNLGFTVDYNTIARASRGESKQYITNAITRDLREALECQKN